MPIENCHLSLDLQRPQEHHELFLEIILLFECSENGTVQQPVYAGTQPKCDHGHSHAEPSQAMPQQGS